MPIYEEEGVYTREELIKLRRYNKCQECGGGLDVFYDFDKHAAFLACKDWSRSHHEGIERESSRYQKEGLASLNLESRREIMVEEHGEARAKALVKYMGGGAITKSIASEIVETLWGEAPTIEKNKAIILCQTYQLNPLMKHLYLIGYKRKVNGKVVVDQTGKPVLDWSIQIGIGATRLLAQRKHNFSYLDMTPRKATQKEIDKILGDTADSECVYGFVHIKDVDTGAEAFGLRGIEKDANIKGKEKGNTHLNQACVRAERQCLDRQYPGEMPPSNYEAVDERFIDAEYRVVDQETGEITESSMVEPETTAKPQLKPHWCEEHNCAYQKKTRGSSTWYAHKLEDGSWCNEKKKAEAPPASTEELSEEPLVEGEFHELSDAVPGAEELAEAESDSQAEAENNAEAEKPSDPNRKATELELHDLTVAMQDKGKDMKWLGQFCNVDRGWKIQKPADLTRYQLDYLFEELIK